jgi:hypothetical protein
MLWFCGFANGEKKSLPGVRGGFDYDYLFINQITTKHPR